MVISGYEDEYFSISGPLIGEVPRLMPSLTPPLLAHLGEAQQP